MPKSKADLIASSPITPELLGEAEACVLLGIGQTLFRALRTNRQIPAPLSIPGSRLKKWRRGELMEVVEKWANDPRRRLTA